MIHSTPGQLTAKFTSVCDGIWLGVRVRVVDRADLPALGFELAHRRQHVAAVDLEALGRGVHVASAAHAHRASVLVAHLRGRDRDHSAALVRRLLAGVGDDRLQQVRRDVHARSPPDGGVEILDLVDRQRVDAARQVLPAVVGDDEDDVALVELTGDAHRHARDRAA